MTIALRPSPVTEWFQAHFSRPTPAQAAAWPKIQEGANVLILSPTGTGKTLAAFLSVLNQLAIENEQRTLQNTFHAIYISPLRALSYDLEKNLSEPLHEIYGGKSPIRVGLRTGDTPASERKKQLDRPPHILLTTPESLCLLLSQSKWLPHLGTVRWIIVDEIHALAENKRGAHLSLSLERLEDLARSARPPSRTAEPALKPESTSTGKSCIQRIGLSATVAPVALAAQFLVGSGRNCEIVDVSTAKQIDLRVYSPLGKSPYPPAGYTGIRLIKELARLVKANRTTLIFTNTRSGAEAATYWLRSALPDLEARIECHHASLDRDLRQEVEDRLKRGELRAVVCSTSLELGIDIGSIDLVVMLSTPKGVSKALQRTGRAGHNIQTVSRGLLMATNLNDLVECCATALLARARHLDPIRLPQAPLDILAQHLVSMGCTQRWQRNDALNLVRGSHVYGLLSASDFNDVLDYLAGGGKALRQQYAEVFGKITLDDEGFETRAGMIRRDFLQNVGVIPNEGVVQIKLKSRNLGTVEESFVRQLAIGDVFMIGGRPVRLERTALMQCFVSRVDQSLPTVPRWNTNKMPLTNRVAQEIASFRSEIRNYFEGGEGVLSGSPGSESSAMVWALQQTEQLTEWIANRLDCGLRNARIIFKMHAAQHQVSEIPTGDFLLIEELFHSGVEADFMAQLDKPAAKPNTGKGVSQPFPRTRRVNPQLPVARHYFFHSLIGRAANDALSRVVALRLSQVRGGNAIATPDDSGFVLTVAANQQFSAQEALDLLSPERFKEDLEKSLARSELLKYHFRNAAQTGLMVYRNYFGEQKSIRKLQWSSEVIFNVLRQHEPEHVLLREAYRDAVHTFLDEDGAVQYLKGLRARPIRLRPVDRVPPLSFAMFATKIKEALHVEDPRETMERLYHLWWSRIEAPVS